MSGDRSAFGELFNRHVRRLWNHAYRLTGSWAQAEDVTSATFLTAWRRRSEITLVHDSALPWLYAVMGNLVRDERRGVLRRLRLVRRVPEPLPAPDHADLVADRVDDEALARQVVEAISELPVSQRQVVELCLIGGLSQAAVIGIEPVTVRAHLSRAKTRLRGILEGAKP